MRRFAYPLIKDISKAIQSPVVIMNCYAGVSPFTVIYGFARTLLAISLLVTLLFNDIESLYAEHLFNIATPDYGIFRINLFFAFPYGNLWIPKLISICILIVVISGYLPQITGILHWWVSYSFFNSAIIVDGGDQINSVLAFLLIPVTLLDNRMNHWSPAKQNSNPYKNLLAWGCFLLMELQGAVLYLQAGIEKPYKVSEWRDGSAIYYWLNHNMFGTNEFFLNLLNPLLTNSFFAFTINWAVIAFELTLFGAFFMPPKRRVLLLPIALCFHFLILVLHGLFSFFFSVAGLLIIYLYNRYHVFKFYEN